MDRRELIRRKLVDKWLKDLDYVAAFLELLWEKGKVGPLGDIFSDECPRCYGEGYIEETECPDCRGEGRYYDDDYRRYVRCESCGGSGFMRESCPRCDGKGKVFVFDSERYNRFLRRGGEKLLRKYVEEYARDYVREILR